MSPDLLAVLCAVGGLACGVLGTAGLYRSVYGRWFPGKGKTWAGHGGQR